MRTCVPPPVLIFDRQEAIIGWAELQMPRLGWKSEDGGPNVFGRTVQAVGIGWNGELIGACLFHDLHARLVEISLVTTHPRWATRPIIRRLMQVVFVDLGCEAVRARAAVDNRRARAMLRRLGFCRAPGAGRTMIVYVLPREDCRWLGPQHWHPRLVTDRCQLH